jgi:hypothetical protein
VILNSTIRIDGSGVIAISESDNLLFEMVDIVDACHHKIVRTSQGLYLLNSNSSVPFRRSSLTVKDVEDLVLSDNDNVAYREAEI